MTRVFIPQSILDLAHRRSAAREAHDWATADQLRGQIEAAGWRVIDAGTDFRLEPATPPDIEVDGGVMYGRSDAVPSRLTEPDACRVSVILVAPDEPDALDRTIAALDSTAPAGTQVIVVADAPASSSAARLPASRPAGEDHLELEVVRTSARLGWGAAWNIGLRRAGGAVAVFMDTAVEATGDVLSPLVAALESAEVAVVGAIGVASRDLVRFEEVHDGPAVAVDGHLLAFRRADGAGRGPLDEGFRFPRHLDTWWCLTLRDEGGGTAVRRAVVVGGLPLVVHPARAGGTLADGERERLSRRNFYRFMDSFRGRLDLASAAKPG
jgi:hypothetical protein